MLPTCLAGQITSRWLLLVGSLSRGHSRAALKAPVGGPPVGARCSLSDTLGQVEHLCYLEAAALHVRHTLSTWCDDLVHDDYKIVLSQHMIILPTCIGTLSSCGRKCRWCQRHTRSWCLWSLQKVSGGGWWTAGAPPTHLPSHPSRFYRCYQ